MIHNCAEYAGQYLDNLKNALPAWTKTLAVIKKNANIMNLIGSRLLYPI